MRKVLQVSSSSSKKKGRIKMDDLNEKAQVSKPPAWVDPADTQPTKISLLKGHSRLRKLREAAGEDEITGREYETRLRSQFERINPEPVWVRRARGGWASEGDEEEAEEVEEEEEGIQDLLASTTGLVA